MLILVKVVPYKIAWGGRLKSDLQMYIFEIVSIGINLFLSWVLLLKANILTNGLSSKGVTWTLWVFLVLFVANTIGNLFAKTLFEKYFSLLKYYLPGNNILRLLRFFHTPQIEEDAAFHQ